MVKKSIDRSANIYVQPHQGFNSDIAAKTKASEAIKHVISWYKNRGSCFDEQLPYY
jgi:D-lactate dehydrogenase